MEYPQGKETNLRKLDCGLNGDHGKKFALGEIMPAAPIHIRGIVQSSRNFVEKSSSGQSDSGNDHCSGAIIGLLEIMFMGDSEISGFILRGGDLDFNLFSCRQFCDSDLEVASESIHALFSCTKNLGRFQAKQTLGLSLVNGSVRISSGPGLHDDPWTTQDRVDPKNFKMAVIDDCGFKPFKMRFMEFDRDLKCGSCGDVKIQEEVRREVPQFLEEIGSWSSKKQLEEQAISKLYRG
ncbi:hypothetical protein Tco_1211876 [Tanacetum coccineum]